MRYAFLGVDGQFRPAMAGRRVNASLGAPRVGQLDRWLKRGAASLRHAGFDRLVWHLSRSRFAECVRRLNAHPLTPQPLPVETLAELYQSFAPEVRATADLIGRDVPVSWLAPMTQPTEAMDVIRP